MKRVFQFIVFLCWCSHLFAQLHIGPYLQDITANSITIIWETDNAIAGAVKYGTSAQQLIYNIAEEQPTTLHRITLTALSPQTSYFYRCFWGVDSVALGRFTTAPIGDETTIRVMIYGDSRNNPAMHNNIVRTAATMEPNFIINSGDLVDDGNNYSSWRNQLFDPIKDYMRNIPFYAVPGNHENESENYYRYVHGKKWWSMDYGMVHVIGLNSNIPGDPSSEQYQWLEQDLKANQHRPWIIVIFHQPLFHVHRSRAVPSIRYDWHPLFMKYGVDLVFSGHDHYYLRTHPIGRLSAPEQSVVYYIAAGGGAPLYEIMDQPYTAIAKSVHHFTMLDISPQQITINAYSPEGALFDSYVLPAQKQFTDKNFIEYAVYELEQQLLDAFGALRPVKISSDTVAYDTTFSISQHFGYPIKCQLRWEMNEHWQVAAYPHEMIFEPGAPVRLSFKASAAVAHAIPTPALKIQLQVDHPSSQQHKYQSGFRNQSFNFSLEKAAFHYAKSVTSDNLDPIFHFIRFFEKSHYVSRLAEHLNELIYKNKNPEILARITDILSTRPSPIKRTYYYPIYFMFDDFSHWDDWLAAIAGMPDDLSKELPDFIHCISYIDKLNMRFLTDWLILGPFDSAHLPHRPEQLLHIQKKFKGGDNRYLQWQAAKSDNDNFLNLKTYFTSSTNSKAGFAFTTIDARSAGEILLLLGTGGDTRVWINKQQVFLNDVNREAEHCQDVIPVVVQQGKNEMLIQTASGDEDWGLYCQLIDKDNILVTGH